MRFTQDVTSKVNFIRGYAAGELRVNEDVFHTALIVGATSFSTADVTAVSGLTTAHAAQVLSLEPELVLLGTGVRQIFPAAAFGAQFLEAGVGFEVMDTGAACRTFNVLVGEQRQVIALLLL